jgi:peptidoglycan/LPS O-acetylase OafA/YrhL
LLLLLSGFALLLHSAMTAWGATNLNHDIPRLGILRALIDFCMGTILCALWTRWRGGHRAAFVACILPLGMALAIPGLPETLVAPILLAALLFLVAITAGARFNPLASWAIHYLGLISYSTYLAHFLLFRFFKIAFVDAGGALSPMLLGLYLLLTLAASIALFHGVERPAQRALLRRIESARLRHSPAVVPAE